MKIIRAILKRDVCRFPDFMAHSNMTGMLLCFSESFACVKMDEHIPGCEEWENCIHWNDPEDFDNDVLLLKSP